MLATVPAAKKTAPAAKTSKKKEYGAAAITVLEGLEAVRKRPGHVYRLHRRAWSAPSRVGGRRQRRRRGDGRIRDEGRRPDPRGRRGRGPRRRPRHPRRDARKRCADRRRRDDPAARRRKVRRREQRLHRRWRPARRRRLRGERAVHPARGRHLPRRPRVVPVLRPRRCPAPSSRATPPRRPEPRSDSGPTPTSSRPPTTTSRPWPGGCRRWPSSTRA